MLYLNERATNALMDLAVAKLPVEQERKASTILDSIDRLAVVGVKAFNSSVVVQQMSAGAFTSEFGEMV